MKKESSVRVILVLTIVSALLGAIFYSQLPDSVGMQISTQGTLRNFIPKYIAIPAVPIILLVLYLVVRVDTSNDTTKYLMISVIVFFAGILTLYFNLKGGQS